MRLKDILETPTYLSACHRTQEPYTGSPSVSVEVRTRGHSWGPPFPVYNDQLDHWGICRKGGGKKRVLRFVWARYFVGKVGYQLKVRSSHRDL